MAAARAHVGETKVFSTKRACPVCGTSYPELDPRMFSYNSKHGWCTTCVGTGLALTREQRAAYDDTVLGADDNRGREQSLPSEEQEPEGVGDTPCPDCSGTRLNPVARAVTFEARARLPMSRQWTVSDTRALGGRPAAQGPRCGDRARRGRRRSPAACSSWRKWGWAT